MATHGKNERILTSKKKIKKKNQLFFLELFFTLVYGIRNPPLLLGFVGLKRRNVDDDQTIWQITCLGR